MGKRHEFTTEEEQALIVKAQKGDKRAVVRLVDADRPFIRSLAAQVCRRVIHRPDISQDLDDLESVGVAEYLYKLTKYNIKKSNGCRMRNYAYLDMKFAMQRYACAGLETIPLPNNHKIHAAHRDYESGASVAEVVEKHGITVEAARSLHRGTVSFNQLAEDDIEIPSQTKIEPDDERTIARRAWELLDPLDRRVLTEMRFDSSPRRRAKLAGRKFADQKILERRALRNAKAALQRIQDLDNETNLLAFSPYVWLELSADQQAFLGLHYQGMTNPRHKSKVLGMNESEVIQLGRSTWDIIRRFLSEVG